MCVCSLVGLGLVVHAGYITIYSLMSSMPHLDFFVVAPVTRVID